MKKKKQFIAYLEKINVWFYENEHIPQLVKIRTGGPHLDQADICKKVFSYAIKNKIPFCVQPNYVSFYCK